jgi:zinc/manganese transport system substrate-binding protein
MRMIPKSALLCVGFMALLSACSSAEPVATARPDIVVTYSVLGSVVSELVGDSATVTVLIPDGQDPHEFQPSARDIETINNASIVISNGLDFEEGLLEVLATAESNGVPQFRVGNSITQRTIEGEHVVADPHLWLSPTNFIQALPSLTEAINAATGLSIDSTTESERLKQLDSEVTAIMSTISSCVMVSGHDELGYFADHYGCTVIGAIIPGLSTTSEGTAKQLAVLKDLATANNVKAIFTGLGTSQNVADQLANELGIKAVTLSTHYLQNATNYREFMINLANQIAEALR